MRIEEKQLFRIVEARIARRGSAATQMLSPRMTRTNANTESQRSGGLTTTEVRIGWAKALFFDQRQLA
jgi:hypothetical protein